jgi:hypothetical protein
MPRKAKAQVRQASTSLQGQDKARDTAAATTVTCYTESNPNPQSSTADASPTRDIVARDGGVGTTLQSWALPQTPGSLYMLPPSPGLELDKCLPVILGTSVCSTLLNTTVDNMSPAQHATQLATCHPVLHPW